MSEVDGSRWVSFRHALPQASHARNGMVLTKTYDGSVGAAMWDWISPAHPQAALLWETNGFVAWQPED